MLDAFPLLVLVLTGVYFIALGLLCVLAPTRASTFLMGFAGSAGAHYAELSVRIVVGLAFVAQAAQSPFPMAFSGFGWLLVGTSAVLVLFPWRWHRAFAQRAVPQALRYLPAIAVGSLGLGVFVLWCVFPALAALLGLDIPSWHLPP
ncbi:MAG TPA: hypothetical protein VFY12_12285 [Arenimonas sp.]|nr:hypothetical protein [Arenimonas sp.]